MDLFEKFIWAFIFIIIFGSIGLLVWILSMGVSPEKISLNKLQWQCTQTKPHTTTIYVKAGDVMIPMEQTVDECVNYKRNF